MYMHIDIVGGHFCVSWQLSMHTCMCISLPRTSVKSPHRLVLIGWCPLMHHGSFKGTCCQGRVTEATVGRRFPLEPTGALYLSLCSCRASTEETSLPPQTGDSPSAAPSLAINPDAGLNVPSAKYADLSRWLQFAESLAFTRAELTLWILLECHISACERLSFIEDGGGSETQPLYENILRQYRSAAY